MSRQSPTPKAAVDDKANHNPMHAMEFGKANTFPDQSATPGTKGKMFTLYALRIVFPGYDSTLRDVLLICVIAIGINRINMEGRQQGTQYIQMLVFTRTKTIGQRHTSTMLYCPPEPILL